MADKNEDVVDEAIGSIKDNPFLNKRNKKPEDAQRQRKCRESTRHANPIQNRIKMLQAFKEEAKDGGAVATRKSAPKLGRGAGGEGKLPIPSVVVSPCNQQEKEKEEDKEVEERKPRKLRMSRRNFMQQRNDDDNPQRKVRASTRHNVPVAQRMRILKEELKKDEARAGASKLAPGFRRKTFRNIKRIEERKAGFREVRAMRKSELEEVKEERLDEVMEEITRKPIQLAGENKSKHKRRCDEALADSVKLMNAKQEFRKIEKEEEEDEEEEDEDLYEDDSDEEYDDDDDDYSDEDDEESLYDDSEEEERENDDDEEEMAAIEERLRAKNLLDSRDDKKKGGQVPQEKATATDHQ